jgi:hypothetical protein
MQPEGVKPLIPLSAMIELDDLNPRIDALCARLKLKRRDARDVRQSTRHAAEQQYYFYRPAFLIAGLVAARFRWSPPEVECQDAAVAVFTPILDGGEPTPEQLRTLETSGRLGKRLVRCLTTTPRVRIPRVGLNDVDFVALCRRIDSLCVRIGLHDRAHWQPKERAKARARNMQLTRSSPVERAARAIADDLYLEHEYNKDGQTTWRVEATPVFIAILEARALTNEQRTWLLRSESAALRGLAHTRQHVVVPPRDEAPVEGAVADQAS